MGYAINAKDDVGKILFNLETPANTFDNLRLCGYDWLLLIDAVECDGHVSGTGMGKKISLKNIKNALRLLDVNKLKHKTTCSRVKFKDYERILLMEF